jgi:hypothetical protein
MTVTIITQRDATTRTVPITLTVDKDRDGAVRVNAGGTQFSLSPKSVPVLIEALQKVAGIVPPVAPKRRPHGPQEYKGNGKHRWENVVKGSDETVRVVRLRVPGGWLYGSNDDGAMTFVPMPDTVGYGV